MDDYVDFFKDIDHVTARISSLPRWARTAFAARCARRVQPLLEVSPVNVAIAFAESLENAITMTETAAAKAVAPPTAQAKLDALLATRAHLKATNIINANTNGAYIVDVYNAVLATVTSLVAEGLAIAEAAANASMYALNAAVDANIEANLYLDFMCLEKLAELENWTDNTAVPPEIFGKLWPSWRPEQWPLETTTSIDNHLIVELDIPDNATEDDIKQRVVDITRALDTLHRSYGGGGLEIHGIDIPRRVGAREGVPS